MWQQESRETLKVNEGNAPGSPEALALDGFKKIVEEQSKGEIKIRIFWRIRMPQKLNK